jgi:hypothetical protein
MKQIFTLCSLGATMFFINPASSQTISEQFENDSAALAASCWQFLGTNFATSPGPHSQYVINGTGSLYSDPPVNLATPRITRTPMLAVGTSITVSFNYRLSVLLSGLQTRTIELDLTNSSGATVQTLATINMDINTNNNTLLNLFSQTFVVNTPGSYRLAIAISGTAGGGNSRISIDDLVENAHVIGCPAISTLPVTLISFVGNLNNGRVNLQWAVAQNENDDHFEVEKGTDGKTFETAAVVMTSLKGGAESYSYSEVMNSEKVYYRLKMFDKNQVITYSKTIAFDNKTTTAGATFRIINNPTTDKLTLSFSSEKNQPMEIKIYDMAGRLQMDEKMNAYRGSNLVNVPLNSAFTTGMYAVELSNASERQTAKFVKQ